MKNSLRGLRGLRGLKGVVLGLAMCGWVGSATGGTPVAPGRENPPTGGTPVAPERARKIKVACIGDSITYGYAMTNRLAECYPTQLQKMLGDGYEVRNFGDPGAGIYLHLKMWDGKTPRAWRLRAEYEKARAFQPDIVVSNLGINDAPFYNQELTPDVKTGRRTVPRGTFRREYEELLTSFLCREKLPRIILWTRLGPCVKKHSLVGSPIPFAMESDLETVANDLGAERLDMYTPLRAIAETDDFCADGIHPEGGACTVIAHETAKAILDCPPEPTFTRQRLFSGFDGKTCKIVPMVATDGAGTALMTWQKLLLKGCDVFYGTYMSRSDDGGRTWSEPVEQSALADTHEGDLRVAHAATPFYNRTKGRWFALGFESLYKNDAEPFQKYVNGRPYQRPLEVSVDAVSGRFTGYKPLPFPLAYTGAMPFGQIAECENGDIIVPFYFSTSDNLNVGPFSVKSSCVTVRYAFGEDGLKVVAAGRPIVAPGLKRGVGEPSAVRFGGKYYLTLRSDERGMIAMSDDGLTFSEPIPWRWEDGCEIGNRNTQQHWLVVGRSLYLAYTRERADNRHVFRTRAPVFMARVDPVRGCLLRETERPLVPELGARLGNFCCCRAGETGSWLVTAEWMQPLGCERYGSDNSLWLIKIDR